MSKLFTCLPIATAAWLGASAQAQTTQPQASFAPPSSAGAATLQSQIETRLQAALGDRAKLPSQAAQVQPDGDHYDLSVLVAPFIKGFSPKDAAFTAKMLPGSTGGWTVDDAQFPAEFEITTTEATPAPSQTPQGSPSEGGAGQGASGTPRSATYQVKLGAQDEHETLDASGMAISNSGSIASVDIVKTGGLGASLTHVGRISNQYSLRPSTPGHSDVALDIAAEGYAVQTADANNVRSELTADRLHVSATMTGLSYDAARRLSAELTSGPAFTVPPKGAAPTPAQTARLHQVLIASEGLLTGAQILEEADGLKFDFGGHRGGVGKIVLTSSGQAPQDMLTASVGLTVEGLTLDELPPVFATYVPSRISLRPTASNLSVSDLTKLALDALSPEAPIDPATGKPAPPVTDYQALFSHGGLQVGFDQLAIDLPGTQFSGTGSFTLTGPQSINGAAQIIAHGLDDLITRLQADPVAARAAPVLILLKGIAKTTPDGALWQITVQGKKVLVNGLDLAAMAAAMH